MKLDRATLIELLAYTQDTGVFTWLVNRGRNACKGKVAGYKHRGYVVIEIDGTPYRAHQLAWLYVKGRWPTGLLDHIDRNGLNNAIRNLRECADHSANAENRSMRCDNSTGFPGVTLRKTRCPERPYEARLQKGGRRLHLGNFQTAEEAYEAYLFAKAHMHTFNPTSVI